MGKAKPSPASECGSDKRESCYVPDSFQQEDFGKMSTAEKDLVYQDIYGMQNDVAEPDSFVDTKLLELETELDRLSTEKRDAYAKAMDQEREKKTDYVRNANFRRMFLRAERFDTAKAAVRLASFFETKLEIFGIDKLTRSIVQSDLDERDKEVLNSGFINHKCGTDRGGRMVVFLMRERLRVTGLMGADREINIKRAMFYQLMATMECHEESQKKGLVIVSWNIGPKTNPQLFRRFGSAVKMSTNAIPMRLSAIHNCFNHNKEQVIYILKFAHTPREIRTRTKLHEGEAKQALFELATYGIDADSLPVTTENKFQLDKTLCVIEVDRKIEESKLHQEVLEAADNTKVSFAKGDGEKKIIKSKSKKQFIMAKASSDYGLTSEQGSKKSDPNNVDKTKVQEKRDEQEKHSNESTLEKLPLRLMDLLDSGVANDAIWWLAGGNAIAIQQEKFSREVISKHFHGIKYDSFLRRLRRW